jgi:hypothetical protein
VIIKGMGEDIQVLPLKKEWQKIHRNSKEWRPLEEHTWESLQLGSVGIVPNSAGKIFFGGCCGVS